jgi:restriction system protein
MDQIEVRSPNWRSISAGELKAKFSADGTRILRYYIDFWHNDLHLHKELSAPEIYLLQRKVDALMISWDKKLEEHRKHSAVSAGRELAEQMTRDAIARLKGMSSILAHALTVNDRVDWEALKDRRQFVADSRFSEARPQRRTSAEPYYQEPRIGLVDILFGRKRRKIAQAQERHRAIYEQWLADEERNAALYSEQMHNWTARKLAFEADYADQRQQFLADQAARNAKVDELARGVLSGSPQSVIEHATLVLEKSDYGDLFEKSFEVDYVSTDRTMLVEYSLPSPDKIPSLKSARFIPSSGEIRETHISEREKTTLYDLTCYQICLRTLHEIFESDEHGNVERVLFNGFAEYVDRRTGQDTRTCIMSILVNRADFQAIDLSRVDPKACFRKLKGVSASTLSALTPIPPVMELNKEDRRFIEARGVAAELGETTNLASMDWADFEHLVRELFDKEFATRGGEVKITQASSDGGVDAIAFDPDPITGGKIVIQAKRYTRTVGVSAVRDLYGTMQHESASRGILITTTDYGPDAYQFASGKPITLFTGSNLLHLLEKHGYQAKIDVREARKILNLR